MGIITEDIDQITSYSTKNVKAKKTTHSPFFAKQLEKKRRASKGK